MSDYTLDELNDWLSEFYGLTAHEGEDWSREGSAGKRTLSIHMEGLDVSTDADYDEWVEKDVPVSELTETQVDAICDVYTNAPKMLSWLLDYVAGLEDRLETLQPTAQEERK